MSALSPGRGRIVEMDWGDLTVDSNGVSTSIETTLAAELERPRELSPQVVKHISRNYDIDEENVGHFLVDELPKLEDYEHDLILSPLFTPKLADQAVFAEVLGGSSVPRDQWPALIQQLAARPTQSQILTSDNRLHSVLLREVVLERYVYRLRLDGRISESILKLVDRTPPADGPLLKAIARRTVWEDDGHRTILERYLTNTVGSDKYRLDHVLALLNVVENYRPADLEDLIARLPRWQDALRQQVESAFGAKPFFSERVQEMHGGDRDHRAQEDSRLALKQDELTFLIHLEQILFPGR